MPQGGLTIGQASQQTGLSAKAIRIYERKGLLPKADRTSSGYRLFQGTDVDVLRFIRQARSIGLRLDEIKDVLDLQRSGQRPCETVIAMLDAHITEIDRTLSDLTSLRSTLAKACTQARASRDRGDGGVICEIIEAQGQAVAAAAATNLRHSATHLRHCSAHSWHRSQSQVRHRAAHCSQISAQSSQILGANADPRDIKMTHRRHRAAQSRHMRPQSTMSGEPSQHR